MTQAIVLALIFPKHSPCGCCCGRLQPSKRLGPGSLQAHEQPHQALNQLSHRLQMHSNEWSPN